MLRFITILLIFIVSSATLSADDLLYHENLDGDCTDLELSIDTLNGNNEYTLRKNHQGEVLSLEHILVDSNGNTLEWFFQNFSEDLKIEASRSGDKISLIQTKGRRKKTEEYHIKDNAPWHQLFPFGMEDFITTGENERSFWFIQPENLKLSSLRAIAGRRKNTCDSRHTGTGC